MEKERAVEIVAHQIAGATHLMLAHARMTVAELKAAIDAMPSPRDDTALIDDLLAGRNPHKIRLSLLSDIAFTLGGEWSFDISRAANEAPQQQAAEAIP